MCAGCIPWTFVAWHACRVEQQLQWTGSKIAFRRLAGLVASIFAQTFVLLQPAVCGRCDQSRRVGDGQAVAAWMVFVLRAARTHLVRHIAWRKGSLNDAIVDLLCSTTYPRCGLQRVRSPRAFSWCTQHGGSFVGALKCCLYEWMGVGATTRSY